MKFDIPFPSVVNDVITRLFNLTAAEYPAITPGPKLFIMLWITIFPNDMKLCCKMLGTAITTSFLNIGKENTAGLSVAFIFEILLNTTIIASSALTPWQINVAHATPAIPKSKAVTNRMSAPIFAVEDMARKINGVFESPRAENIPVATL